MTPTQIVNGALVKLGVTRITNITDEMKAAQSANTIYERVRDAELRAHWWNFAMVRTTLQADSTEPSWGFDRQFLLPADCLRLIQVDEFYHDYIADYRDAPSPPYQLEGRAILTDLSAPLKIRYVKQTAENYDALFVDALTCRLAMELCEELTQSATKYDKAAKEYQRVILQARRTDAIENPPEPPPDDSWVLGRL